MIGYGDMEWLDLRGKCSFTKGINILYFYFFFDSLAYEFLQIIAQIMQMQMITQWSDMQR